MTPPLIERRTHRAAAAATASAFVEQFGRRAAFIGAISPDHCLRRRCVFNRSSASVSAILQAKLGQTHALSSLPLLDGACSLDPYEADQCSAPYLPFRPDTHRRQQRNALACDRWLWPNAEVPYVNQLADESITKRLMAAIRRIERVSCVRFRQANASDRKFLTVKQSRPLAGRLKKGKLRENHSDSSESSEEKRK
uniref:Peptidase M12A domain-containing protein n=1 Tax=Plectus sambesii TaxID=2011161 RepID=A0A914VJ23_9BILA